ncbi:MAG: Fe2+-dependent dioxygenase [Cyanobacteriota bacterium]|nr:Fe2+-dependent dioxygenase [Cyanobacteriota bacterium]
MTFRLEPLLDPTQLQGLVDALQAADAPWQSGQQTAGWHARLVKHNHQLDRASSLHQQLSAKLLPLLEAHPLIAALAFPRRLHGLLFSRSGPGEGYGRHVDNAWMAGGRSDLSFTVFLTAPQRYSGGDLVLETDGGEQRLRLPAGHAIVYPSTLLHRVEPVSAGERLVAVGWIESRIRQPEQRQLLFELDTARRLAFQRHGKEELFDLISRSYSNLLRHWDS